MRNWIWVLGALGMLALNAHATSFKFPETWVDLHFERGSHVLKQAQQLDVERRLRSLKEVCTLHDQPIFIIEGGGVPDSDTTDAKTQRTQTVRGLVERMGFDAKRVYEAVQTASPTYKDREAAVMVQIQFTCIPRR